MARLAERVAALEGGSPDDALSEGLDLLVPLLDAEEGTKAEALQHLSRLCGAADAREAWLYLCERLSGAGSETTGGLVACLCTAVTGVLRRAGSRAPSRAVGLSSDLCRPLLRLTQQDSAAVAVLSGDDASAEPSQEPTFGATSPATARGAAVAVGPVADAAAALAEAACSSVADAARRIAEEAVLALVFRAVAACVCSQQFRPPASAAAAPTATAGGHSDPRGGALQAREEEIIDTSAACDAAAAKLIGTVRQLATARGGLPWVLAARERWSHWRYAAGLSRGDGKPTERQASGFAVSDSESESDGDDGMAPSPTVPWDDIGVGCYLLRALSDPAATPSALSPVYLLAASRPYLAAMLTGQQGRGTSLCGIAEGLELLETLVGGVDAYSIAVTDGGDVSTRDLDKDALHSTEEFAGFFEVAQCLAHVMTHCPVETLRVHAHKSLLGFLERFAEFSRFKMITSIVKLCPHASVSALLLSHLKDEVNREYDFVAREVDSQCSADADGQCRRAAAERAVRHSAFLQKDVIEFVCAYVLSKKETLAMDSEPVCGALSLLYFVVVREKRRRLLGFDGDFLRRISEHTLPAIRAAADTMDCAPTGVQARWLLEDGVSRLADAIAECTECWSDR